MKLDIRNKKVTVMGLGLHGGGVGVAQWLAQQGAHVLVTDLRLRKVLAPSIRQLKRYKIQYVLGKHRPRDFINADVIIKNPGVPRDSKFLQIARNHHIPIETDMSLFLQVCPGSIIGITGTKGKSTATMLLYHILKKWKSKALVAGNIRISPLSILKKNRKSTPVVLELSSWQLEDMDHLHKSPHIAVITNIMPDHLNRYRNMASYVESKKIIFQYQTQDDYAVLNRDNTITKRLGAEVVSKRYWFSRRFFKDENGCYVKASKIFFRENGRARSVLDIRDIALRGMHNVENVLAAVCVAKILGVPEGIVRSAIKKFHGIPGRLETIRTVHGIQFINDTTATTPDASIAALKTFQKSIILIAGGVDKGLRYGALIHTMKRTVKRLIFLKGSATNKMIPLVRRKKIPSEFALNMRDAVQRAYNHAKIDDIVLLSPAAASFNQFLNEFDRGEQFKRSVHTIHI